MHGYLASVASIYGAVWSVKRGAAPSPPLPPSTPLPAPPSGGCVNCQRRCVTVPTLPNSTNMCNNMTGRWTGTWTGGYIYNVRESINHEVVFCSDLKRDCWSSATGIRHGASIHLTFHRCQPYANVSKTFTLDAACGSMATIDGKYTRLLVK